MIKGKQFHSGHQQSDQILWLLGTLLGAIPGILVAINDAVIKGG
jgi:hypothetical protein